MNATWYYHWLRYKLLKEQCLQNERIAAFYTRRRFLNYQEANDVIAEEISGNRPFMACRIGASEAFTMRTFHFGHVKNMDKCLTQITMWSGFFPAQKAAGEEFAKIMQQGLQQADLCGTLIAPLDDYFIAKNLRRDAQTMMLSSVEPYFAVNPWSKVLKGKRVLVVHPFADSIQSQYQKRELLFPKTQMLPEMDLIVYHAIQTSGGERDSRFESWFEALAFMEREIAQIEFDVALLGCGAYGLPLAAAIKQQGRQAIHIGGSLQLLFGIRGKRWDEMEEFQTLFNDAWIYPAESEKPKKAGMIEGACYW